MRRIHALYLTTFIFFGTGLIGVVIGDNVIVFGSVVLFFLIGTLRYILPK